MQIKKGASVVKLTPQCVLAMCVTESVYNRHELELTITSAFDGKHMEGSKHYSGEAFDGRTHNVPRAELPILVAEVRGALGPEYDVVLEAEGTDNEHIHVEYDPT